MRREPADHTLQPTALINEAWLRLIDWKPAEWRNRAQFFGVVAQVMRRVLVDHARRRRALKHGGDALKVSLAQAEQWPSESGADVIALNDALVTLASFDERKSRIVELRFFGGMTEEETAEAMEIPDIVKAVTHYVALRVIERDKALATNTMGSAATDTGRSGWRSVWVFLLGLIVGCGVVFAALWAAASRMTH